MPTITADGIYYVDMGTDPLFTDGSFVSVYPEGLEFDDMIKGVGNISFQLSFSALDADGDLAVPPPEPPDYVPFIGPYRDYFRLRCGNIAIMAGPIVKTHAKYGADFMDIYGKTWEHILERWLYPFDPRVSPDHTEDYQFDATYQNDELVASGVPLGGTGLAYQAYHRDVIYIWGDIMSEIMNDSPHRLSFDISRLAILSTIKTSYNLSLGDTSTLFSMIDSLSGTGQGFDWWISHDMKVRWGSPYRFGNNASPTTIYTLDSDDDLTGFLDDSDFTNNGPEATHVLGLGAGLATQTRLGAAYGDGASQIEFTKLDQSYDFGDVRNRDQLVGKTRKQLSLSLNPQHEIPLSVSPNLYPDGNMAYWQHWRKGRAISMLLHFGYHRVDSPQQLVSYKASLTDTGDATVEWTLQQIYDTNPSAGVAEG